MNADTFERTKRARHLLRSPLIVLATTALPLFLTGCDMDSSDDSGGIPSAGISSTENASDKTKQISSEIYDLIGVKGKLSEPGPGVHECDGKDKDRFFQAYHPWSLVPPSAASLDGVMERLKTDLPRSGWKIMSYGRDSSRNRNVSLTADNDKKKFSVNITHFAKDDPPMLMVEVVSGCYEVPEGQHVETF
ncbi:hypothetical protein [Streptomyces sp. NPDC050560]|uniref:hypothetical protein n=1 Tax=Streptomyces sp. NPDC050560 TaxID=3365630 RepID=UPI00378C7FC7